MSERRVLKWEVRVDDLSHVVPGRFLAAAPLDVAILNIWTEVDDEADSDVMTRYRVFGTGQPLSAGVEHRATVQAPPFVWHLYSWPTP